jgi:hypothetical protein
MLDKSWQPNMKEIAQLIILIVVLPFDVLLLVYGATKMKIGTRNKL